MPHVTCYISPQALRYIGPQALLIAPAFGKDGFSGSLTASLGQWDEMNLLLQSVQWYSRTYLQNDAWPIPLYARTSRIPRGIVV